MYALWHVDEGTARPCRGVQCAELVVFRRHDLAEILADQIRVFADRGIGVNEDHALFLQIIANRIVDDLGFVLRRDAGDQTLLLRFRDAELVVGIADIVGKIFPTLRLLLDRLDIVLEIVGVEAAQINAPRGHRLVDESLVAAQTHVKHPLRLVLVGGDGPYDVLVNAFLRRFAGCVGIMPAVVVVTELADDLVILLDLVLVDAGTVSHILAHFHVFRGVWCVFARHRTLPPFIRCSIANLTDRGGKH